LESLSLKYIEVNLYFHIVKIFSQGPLKYTHLPNTRFAKNEITCVRSSSPNTENVDILVRSFGMSVLSTKPPQANCSQLQQHFTSSFCANILSTKNYKPKLQFHKSCAKGFHTKKFLVIFL